MPVKISGIGKSKSALAATSIKTKEKGISANTVSIPRLNASTLLSVVFAR